MVKNKRPKLRVLLTGGGTGGHIYPLIAVARELQRICGEQWILLDLRYLGSHGPYKNVLALNNILVMRVAESKLRRYFSLRNFIDGPKFIWSLFQSVFKIYWFMPDILFSKGGPGSVAVVLAARFYRIPVIVHESDTVPGLSNLLSGRYAKLVFTSFATTSQYFSQNEVINVGNPIRQSLVVGLESESKEKNKRIFGYSSELPLILVVGGSQGAAPLNEFILDALPSILETTQVFHQTGPANYEETLKEVAFITEKFSPDLKARYKAVAYFDDDIRKAYLASDLIVSRAGAASIFEIAAFGKPSILVPLPAKVAAGDHQTKNAYEYAANGAAVVMEQTNLLPNLFVSQVQKIIQNPDIAGKMSQAARNFSKVEAASKIAQIIVELWGNARK